MDVTSHGYSVLMSDSQSSHHTPGIDRRQLLTAGVWAAPVIVLATAAPAAAASPLPSSLVFNDLGAWIVPGPSGTVLGQIDGTTSVRVEYAQGAEHVTSMTVVITVSAIEGLVATTPTVKPSSSGGTWEGVSGVVSGESTVYTFTWVGELTPSQGQTQLDFTLPGDNASPTEVIRGKQLTAIVSAPNANSAAATPVSLS